MINDNNKYYKCNKCDRFSLYKVYNKVSGELENMFCMNCD